MRLFLAIDLPDDIIEKIKEIQKKIIHMNTDTNTTKPENLHITLKFLGEVEEHNVDEIEKTVSDVVRKFCRFRVSVEGLGYFGKQDYIRVVWIGTGEGRERLVKLMTALNRELNHIRREDYEPFPHITLARIKSGRNRESLLHEIERLKDVKLGEFDVKKIKLKQSVLTKNGPIYTDLKCFRLCEDMM